MALVGAMALGAIALLFAAMVVRYKQAPGAAYVLAAISLVAGFYFPPSLLPWWLGWASDVQPFTPAVDLLRHLLVGQPLRALSVGRRREARRLHRRLAAARARGVVVGGRSRPPAGYAHGVLDDLAPIRSDWPSRVPEHVVYRDFAEQTVALNLQTGRYHGLNATAGDDARGAARGADRRGGRQRLAPEWDVSPEVLLADLLELCEGLESRGLLETHVAE